MTAPDDPTGTTAPANPTNSLMDPDDVQFRFADDLEEGTGFTPQEIDAILATPLDETLIAAALPGGIKLSAEAYGSDANLREYWTHGEGGAVKIRWGTDGDFKRCVRHLEKFVTDPEGLCNEYHVEAVGAPPGKGHDVTTESFATDVAPVARVGSNNPLSVQWEGVLAVEGTETGDGRMFSNGSLIWPELPIPLMYQYITSHGGQTDQSTNVGNITEMWRDGKFIKGRGTIDVSDAYGMQAARKMKGKYLRGVSIDADGVKESDIELVFPQPDASMSDNEQVLTDLFANPELTIFHAGRVRGATLVNLPAFVEASLDLIGDTSILDVDAGAFATPGVAMRRYVRDPQGRFDDVPGVGNDGPRRNRDLLDTEEGVSIGPGENVDDISEYDDVSEDDDEGITLVPGQKRRKKSDRRQAVDPDNDWRVITAAATPTQRGYTIEIPELPPLEFFQEPTDLPPIGAVWIEPNGHIWGLVGPSGVAHRAFKGKRVTIPMGNVDYTRWMNRPTLVVGPDGEVMKIRTGVITMNCGHLMDFSVTDGEERMRHYDNSCSIAAVVRVGESRKHKAPWVSGTIMPMSTEDFLRFQACQLSGDWGSHPERRGWKEFAAALAVPVPGFPRSTNVAAVRLDDNAVVVASSVPIMLAESTYDGDVMTVQPESAAVESNRLALGRIRARIGSSNRQTLDAIRRRVQAGATPLAASATAPVKEKNVGCAPCAAKRQRGTTSAQEAAPVQVEGFGQGDGEAAAQQSASNAIKNSGRTSRG